MATYYISTTGNDTTGNGSSSTPWATLAKFLSSSTTSDTCICKASSATYSLVTATISDRTIMAETAGTVTFDGAAGDVRWTLSGTVTIRNLIFRNLVLSSSLFYPTANTVFTCHNNVFNTISTGVPILQLHGAGTTLSFIGCVFNDIVHTVSGVGMIEPKKVNTTIIFNNNVVRYKTLTVNEMSLFAANAGTGTITMKNNIFRYLAASPNQWNFFRDVNFTVYVSNNCINDAGTGSITNAPTNTNGITTDPLFVDEDHGDFRLRPTSPCIDTGIIL